MTGVQTCALPISLDIPVVGIDAGMRGDIFGKKTYQTFEIIGKVLKLEDRAEEVNTFIREIEKDLQSRAGLIEESPRMYLFYPAGKQYLKACGHVGKWTEVKKGLHNLQPGVALYMFECPIIFKVFGEMSM